MKKKVILICLLSALMINSLVGCSSNSDKSNSTSTTKNEETNIDESKIQEEVKNNINSNLNTSDIEDNIIIKDESFIAQMDKVYENVDAYMGKKMTVEGMIADIADSEFLLIRYYDMEHGDHTHEEMVGISATYDGAIPAEGTWVKAIGSIDKHVEGEIVTPILKIEKMDMMFTEGQRKVTN